MSAANPFSDLPRIAALEKQLLKTSVVDGTAKAEQISYHFRVASSLGYEVREGARILDLGCGSGDSVAELLRSGFDAYGVDVLELWGKDFDKLWERRDKPKGDHLHRLCVADPMNYRLPFPDNHFDFIFSDQVFEHVFTHEDVFRELVRVLKKGAISVHEFPGPNALIEGHVQLPLPYLCRSRIYLSLCAMLGMRSPRQRGFDWRKTVRLNLEIMRLCNYPTKKQLRNMAKLAGARIDFVEPLALRCRVNGRVAALLKAGPTIARTPLAAALSIVSQRYMVLW